MRRIRLLLRNGDRATDWEWWHVFAGAWKLLVLELILQLMLLDFGDWGARGSAVCHCGGVVVRHLALLALSKILKLIKVEGNGAIGITREWRLLGLSWISILSDEVANPIWPSATINNVHRASMAYGFACFVARSWRKRRTKYTLRSLLSLAFWIRLPIVLLLMSWVVARMVPNYSMKTFLLVHKFIWT